MPSVGAVLSLGGIVAMTGPLALSGAVHAQCIADINADGEVSGIDLAAILTAWGTNGQGSLDADLNDDLLVDGIDLGILTSGWGECVSVPSWAILLESHPDPAVVTSAVMRSAISATGLAWRVRDATTQVELLLIPPGSFLMGCSASDRMGCLADEYPVHEVTLTGAFYLGRYEVTQAEWAETVGTNPSFFQGLPDSPQRPVERVTWNSLQQFFLFPGRPTELGLRLPTEAEWEFAYRAGTQTAYHGTTAVPQGFDEASQLGGIAWMLANSGEETHAVGGKAGNGFGLHDMAGNVWEWVSDRYGGDYYAVSPPNDPAGPSTGPLVLQRGGGFKSNAASCRASQRAFDLPINHSSKIGFRAARTP